MGTKFTLLLLLSTFMVFLAAKKTEYDSETTEWKRVKSRKDVFISSRWTNLNNEDQVKEIKAEICINVPKDNLLNIIQSGIYTSEWMPMVNNCYVNQECSQEEWSSELSLGFCRHLFNYHLETSYYLAKNNTNSSLITFKCDNALVFNTKVNPDFYKYTGSWELDYLNENTSKVILTIRWDKNNIFPYWCASPIIEENIFSALKNLKKLSQEKYYTESYEL